MGLLLLLNPTLDGAGHSGHDPRRSLNLLVDLVHLVELAIRVGFTQVLGSVDLVLG